MVVANTLTKSIQKRIKGMPFDILRKSQIPLEFDPAFSGGKPGSGLGTRLAQSLRRLKFLFSELRARSLFSKFSKNSM